MKKLLLLIVGVLSLGSMPVYVSAAGTSSIVADTTSPDIYPSSVSDFSARYDAASNSITISLTAPTKSHHSLGEINDVDLTYITSIKLFRQVGYATDYVVVHTFESPAPGEKLSWTDTDLPSGGEVYYKAITYVGNCCDYGEYIDEPILIGQVPGDVENFTGSSNQGNPPVTLKWNAPSKDQNGNDLGAIESMELSRYDYVSYQWNVLQTYTDVRPGEEFSYVDTTVLADSQYQYRIICTGSAGYNYGTTISVNVSKDTPSTPQHVAAVCNDNATVTVTWDAVTTGLDNGYLNLDNLTYTILRGIGATVYSESAAVVIAKGVAGTSFTDQNLDFNENVVRYFVKAECDGYVGYSNSSNPVLAGNALTLPFEEGFNSNEGAQNAWLTENNVNPYSYWTFTGSMTVDDEDVLPIEGAGGFAGCLYGAYSSDEFDDTLTGAHIIVEGANDPVLSFNYYGVPTYNSVLRVEASYDNGSFEEVWSLDYRDVLNKGWEKAIVALDVPENAKLMQLRIISHKGAYACPVIIDNVAVFTLPTPQLKGEGRQLDWTIDASEFATLTGFHIYCDGTRQTSELLSPETTSYAVPEAANGLYTVTALYEGGMLESPQSNVIKIDESGIADASVGNGITIAGNNGCITIDGAEGLAVTISAIDGVTVYAAEGNCSVAVAPATYIVKVGAQPAVKISVR